MARGAALAPHLDVSAFLASYSMAPSLSARLQTTLDVLPVGVGIAEASGALTLTNRAFQTLWGEPSPTSPPLSPLVGDVSHYPIAGWRSDGAPIAPRD